MVEYKGEKHSYPLGCIHHFLLENMNIQLREDCHIHTSPEKRTKYSVGQTYIYIILCIIYTYNISWQKGQWMSWDIYPLFYWYKTLKHKIYLRRFPKASDAELPKGLDGQHWRRHRGQTEARAGARPVSTIWLWHSQFAMERFTMHFL
jgi:hypothetical protein